MERVPELAKRMGVLIAVLTVPEFAAQECADLLIESRNTGHLELFALQISGSRLRRCAAGGALFRTCGIVCPFVGDAQTRK